MLKEILSQLSDLNHKDFKAFGGAGQHARVDYSGILQHASCLHVFVDGWVIDRVFVCAECVFFLAVCHAIVLNRTAG